jgi:hypothetical protein
MNLGLGAGTFKVLKRKKNINSIIEGLGYILCGLVLA